MIKNMWYPVLSSREIKKKNKLIGVKRFGENLAFWRDSVGVVQCIFDRCCHRGASISAGKIVEGHAQCPFHGLEFNNDGKCVVIPANGRASNVAERYKVNSFAVKEHYDMIWVFYGEKSEASNHELPTFKGNEDIDNSFYYSEVIDPWKCHYTRCIENQLDCVHLPFVHHDTIGRGKKYVVNGPVVKIEGNGERIFVYNEKDHGQVAKKPEELPEKSLEDQHLIFSFPNIWQNYLFDKMRITAFFVPVDDHFSLVYIRYYHKVVPVPGIGQFIAWLGKLSSVKILHQDRRVVETQLPDYTQLKMDEKLIPGDSPIIEYRKMRDKLLKGNLLIP